MKIDAKASKALIAAVALIVVVGVAFWMLAIGPKRDEVSKLDSQVSKLEASLVLHRGEAEQGREARRQFPSDYQKLVVLGKAVPGDDDTASLLVQINRIAERTGIEFQTIQLTAEGGGEEATASAAAAAGEGASPTEAAASLTPLGAGVGPAGLAVMPYTLKFKGNFFTFAAFVAELDRLVKTTNEDVLVDGRLITVDAFSLAPNENQGFPALEATFSVTTYLTPPGQGVTVGATPTSPETAVGAPAAAITGEAP